MKKIFYLFSLLALPLFGISATNDFSYDKNQLSSQFSNLEQVSIFVEQNNVTYSELSKNPLFEGNLDLTNHISVKPNLKFEEIDWGAFAWGFCCYPIGIFTVLINDKKDQKSKESFWAGVGTSIIVSTASYIGLYTYYFIAFGMYY